MIRLLLNRANETSVSTRLRLSMPPKFTSKPMLDVHIKQLFSSVAGMRMRSHRPHLQLELVLVDITLKRSKRMKLSSGFGVNYNCFEILLATPSSPPPMTTSTSFSNKPSMLTICLPSQAEESRIRRLEVTCLTSSRLSVKAF
jgi:hypothetical protein